MTSRISLQTVLELKCIVSCGSGSVVLPPNTLFQYSIMLMPDFRNARIDVGFTVQSRREINQLKIRGNRG